VQQVLFEGVRTVLDGVEVHRGLSFSVESGQVVCLLGPSGCGKTTALRVIAGLIPRYDGIVRVAGEETSIAWNRLAMVFQSPRLTYWRTALENVILGIELRNPTISKNDRTRRALAWLSTVGLEDSRDKFPRSLSGGEQHRLSLARALAVDPEILLMDEAFSDQDVVSRQRLWQLTLSLCQTQSRTIVLVTHDVEEALFLADRIHVLTAKPATVHTTLDITLPHPRHLELPDPKVDALRSTLHRALRGSSENSPEGL
jgi:NitT/TauT family transport system ATP-binding protein